MVPAKILLLRVGMDLGFGGLGPLFDDGTYEYVPIPESLKHASPRSCYFSQLAARFGGSLDQYVPLKYRNGPAHFDPEFETFTYGDPTPHKRQQLLRLSRGDMLVFYAGLRPLQQRRGSRLYVIGYFTIASVHSIEPSGLWPSPAFKHLWRNAHCRRNLCDPGLVIAEGSVDDSRQLDFAVPLSDDQQNVLPSAEKLLGISGSVKRCGAGRWIPPTHIAQVAQWLRSL